MLVARLSSLLVNFSYYAPKEPTCPADFMPRRKAAEDDPQSEEEMIARLDAALRRVAVVAKPTYAQGSIHGAIMYCMSEEEKEAQVGKLALEYSEVKGRLNHVEEKLNSFFVDAQTIVQTSGGNGLQLQVVDGKPALAIQPGKFLTGLIGSKELVEILEERDRLKIKVAQLTERVRSVAPHLV